MLIIKILGMPPSIPQVELYRLILHIKKAVSKVPVLRISEDKIFVFFPQDLVIEGLGEELIPEINGLFVEQERAPEVQDNLRHAVCQELAVFAQQHLFQCGKIAAFIVSTPAPKDFTLYEKRKEGAFIHHKFE